MFYISFKKISLFVLASLLIFGIYRILPVRDSGFVVAITQIAPHKSLDQIREGFKDQFEKSIGRKVQFVEQNAQGSISIATQIAQNFLSLCPKIVVPITTPSAQTIKSVFKGQKTYIVYAGITNPHDAKLFDDKTLNIQGVSDYVPAKFTVNLLKDIFNTSFQTLRIGVLYNPGEANTVFQVHELEAALRTSHQKLIKKTLQNTSEISVVAKSMINDVDVILVMNDNMVVSGIKQLINIGLDHGVPIIASDNNSVAQGALAAIAYDQYKMGQLAGKMAVDLLNGKEAPKVSTLDKPEIYFNRSSSDKLKIKPADAVLKNASKIYEEAS